MLIFCYFSLLFFVYFILLTHASASSSASLGDFRLSGFTFFVFFRAAFFVCLFVLFCFKLCSAHLASLLFN